MMAMLAVIKMAALSSSKLYFIISLLFFVLLVFLFWDYSMDDAFITLRYAENFADGHGLTFTPGDQPIEAYSNFLWLLIIALLYKLGLPTVFMAKILGPLFFAITGLIWYRYYEKQESEYSYFVAPFLFVSVYSSFWAVSALEMGLYACLLTLLIFSVHKRSWHSFFLLPGVVLSRPEGFAIAFAVIILDLILNRKSKSFSWRWSSVNLMLLILTIVILTMFRLQTFGYPLPNTVYAKSVIETGGLFRLLEGLAYFLPFTALFFYGLWKAMKSWQESSLILIFAGVFLLQSLINCLADVVMNFHFRYLVAFLPFFFAVALYGLSKSRFKNNSKIIFPIFAISLLAPGFAVYQSVQKEKEIIIAQNGIIDFINKMPETPRISMTDIGRIPYHTKAKYNDLWGLASDDIVRDSLYGSREIKRFPDYFIFVGYKPVNKTVLRFGHENMIKTHNFFDIIYHLNAVGLPAGADATVPGYYYLAYKKDKRALDSLINFHPVN